jgi:Ca-activated chloride channel homolog
MTFGHPWLLLLVLLPLAWAAAEWRRAARPLRLLLKALSFAAVLVALAEPTITLPETKTGAVILVDTSASITHPDLARASSVVAGIASYKRRNWMKVVPFSSEVRNLSQTEASGDWRFIQTDKDLLGGTNFETALTSALAAIPAGYNPRLVLLSDGNENEGSSARAVAELQQLQVPVDTIPLAGRPETALRLESLSIPREAYAGEQIPIDLTIYSPQPAQAQVQISADGKSLGTSPADLRRGLTTVRVHARVNSTGAVSLTGKVSAAGLGEFPFAQAISLKRARVLYVSRDPSGSETNLMQALHEAEFEITRDASIIDRGLGAVQLVILNNVDLSWFTAAQKSNLEEYVKNGGGLLLIGGERQLYKQDNQMDALDRVLPAKLAPPKSAKGICVALIIDKSSSMEGRKIELARLSAIGVVDHLKPVDTIGVLIFDNSFQWAVPMRHAQDTSLIKRLISGVTPDGGTQIAPALAEAYRKVLPSKATYKHIVLLTDGISEEGDSIELAKEAQAHQVTISTVGLGQDVNRSYLEKVAATSGGHSYFLNDPQGLEQILLKDVEDYSGGSAVENPLTPIVVEQTEILDGVGMQTAPALEGYTRFLAKPESETILQIDSEKKDPLYVRWQYGLGRAAVFASDAKSRWAEAWVKWPGFDKFWINATRDLLAHAEHREATARFDSENGDIIADYHLGPGSPAASAPAVFVLGPNGFHQPVDLSKTGAVSYQGRVHVGTLRGLFRIRPVNDTPGFPEIGVYRPQEELQDYGSNREFLAQISALTGGRFNPPPSAVFDRAARPIYVPWRLWPGLLALAIGLTIAELIARKWRVVLAAFQQV